MTTFRALADRFFEGESMGCIALREFNREYRQVNNCHTLRWWKQRVEQAVRIVWRRTGRNA